MLHARQDHVAKWPRLSETIYPVDHKMYPGNRGQIVDDVCFPYTSVG